MNIIVDTMIDNKLLMDTSQCCEPHSHVRHLELLTLFHFSRFTIVTTCRDGFSHSTKVVYIMRWSVLAVGLVAATIFAANIAFADPGYQFDDLNKSASLYNERGYLESSSSTEGDDFISEYGGNLTYRKVLAHIPYSAAGLGQTLVLTYNGSVGHHVATGIGAAGDARQNSFAQPEWILSLNGYAIQTFNFENRFLSWEQSTDSTARDTTLSLPITGYHYGWDRNETLAGSFHDVVSILMEDGSVKTLTSQYHGPFFSMDRDDHTRGEYVMDYGFAGDTLLIYGDDGIQVKFLMYEARWHDSTWIGDDITDFVTLVPIAFTDRFGNLLTLEYYFTYSDSTKISGRPLLKRAGDFRFIWGDLTDKSGSCGVLKIYSETTQDTIYTINVSDLEQQSEVSIYREANRGLVTCIEDAIGRKENFYYLRYSRFGKQLLDVEYPSHTWKAWHFAATPYRLYCRTTMNQGIVRYRYVGDDEEYHWMDWDNWPSAWNSGVPGSIPDTAIFDPRMSCDRNCSGYHTATPCHQSKGFRNYGRDPFATNMIAGKVKYICDGTDTTVVLHDSIEYAVTNLDCYDSSLFGARYFIDEDTRLVTVRYRDSILLSSVSSRNIRRDSILFQQCLVWPHQLVEINERKHERNIKSIYSTVDTGNWLTKQWHNVSAVHSYYNMSTIYGEPRLDVDSVVSCLDGGIKKKHYQNFYVSAPNMPVTSPAADTMANIVRSRTTDEFGVTTDRYYCTEFLSADSGCYYSNQLVDSVVMYRGDTLLDKVYYEYYTDTSLYGWPGQTKAKHQLLIAGGSVTDTLTTFYEYVKEPGLTPINGGLSLVVNPDSSVIQHDWHAPILEADTVFDTFLRTCTDQDQNICDTLVISDSGYIAYELDMASSNYHPMTKASISLNGTLIQRIGPGYNESAKGMFGVAPGDTLVSSAMARSIEDKDLVLRCRFAYFSGEGPVDTIAVVATRSATPHTDTTVVSDSGYVLYDLGIDYSNGDAEETVSRIELGDAVIAQLTMCSEQRDVSGSIMVIPGDTVIVYARVSLNDSLAATASALAVVCRGTVPPVVYYEANKDGSMTAQADYLFSQGPFSYRSIERNGSDSLISYQCVDSLGRPVFVVNQQGYVSKVRWDRLGRLDRIVLPYGFQSETCEPDFSIKCVYQDTVDSGHSCIELCTKRDTLGNEDVTRRLFDSFMRKDIVIRYGHADSSIDRLEFDRYDRTVARTDPLGFSLLYSYDGIGRRSATQYPAHPDSVNPVSLNSHYTTAFTTGLPMYPFDSSGIPNCLWVDVSTDENGSQSESFADAKGNVRAVSQLVDSVTSVLTYFDYDAYGHLLQVQRPNGDRVYYEHNSLGWLLKEWAADYDTIYYEYDKLGQVVKVQDGMLRMWYSPITNLEAARFYEYDAIGRVTRSGEVEITDDTLEWPKPESFWTYDQTNQNNTNSVGRLSLTWQGRSEYGRSFNYDARGRIDSIESQFFCRRGTAYDSVENRYNKYLFDGTPFKVRYQYNLADQVTRVEYPDGTVVTYGYDDLGRLCSVGNDTLATYYASISYTVRNEIEQVVYYCVVDSSGVDVLDTLQVIDHTYNERGWLTSINGGQAVDTGHDDRFGENLYYYSHPDSTHWPGYYNGNILASRVAFSPTDTAMYRYTYDGIDRLTNCWSDRSGHWSEYEAFRYDDNGNRTQRDYDGDRLVYEYDSVGTTSKNQLAAVSDGHGHLNMYTYDANGNVVYDSANHVTFLYDIYNQLDYSCKGKGNYVSYGYDVDGNRVWKEYRYIAYDTVLPPPDPEPHEKGRTVSDAGKGFIEYDSTFTWYIRGADNTVLGEYDPIDSVYLYRYIYAGGQRIAMIDQNDKLHFYLNDHLGSARAIISADSTGAITRNDRYLYLCYGESDGTTTNTDQPRRYTGKPLDEELNLDLYYYGARYYDGHLGRFTQIDPLYGYTLNWSPYTYCLDNPQRFIDPDGLKVSVNGTDATDFVQFLDDSTSLSLSRDSTSGELSYTGDPQTPADSALANAIDSKSKSVNIETTRKNSVKSSAGTSFYIAGGGEFGGSVKNGQGQIVSTQYVNMKQLRKNVGIGGASLSVQTMHEVLTAWYGAMRATGSPAPKSEARRAHYDAMHTLPIPEITAIEEIRTIKGVKIPIRATVFGPGGQYIVTY